MSNEELAIIGALHKKWLTQQASFICSHQGVQMCTCGAVCEFVVSGDQLKHLINRNQTPCNSMLQMTFIK